MRIRFDAFTLAALVAELRAALGEHGRQGRFIRTVHRFGYAFSLEELVEEPAGAPATPPAAGAEPGHGACWLSWGERECALKPGAQAVGRDGQVAVRIDALSISQTHARITCGADGVSIEDLQSKNGTWVNGTKVSGAAPLTDGDEVRLGSITLTFRNMSAPRPTATVAPS